MELGGRRCHMTYERMKEEGQKPDQALAFVRDFADVVKSKGIPFVAHGGMFDEKMLAANFIGFKVDPKGFTFGTTGGSTRRGSPRPASSSPTSGCTRGTTTRCGATGTGSSTPRPAA
jgi:hypothetical protein